MSSIGGFRVGEIDGKSFLIYNLLTQPNNPASSSASETPTVSEVDNNGLLQPLFICPNLRLQAEENGYDEDVHTPINISPYFPTTRSGDQQVQDLLDSDTHDDICKLPIAPLFWCNNQQSALREFKCILCERFHILRGTSYYYCGTCDEKYHKECVESPSLIKYPSYPFLSFQLSFPSSVIPNCFCCKIPIHAITYYCSTSKLNVHPVCAMKPIPFVIDHSKRHPHPLTFFPKQAFLPCHVCGLIKESSIPTYLCVSCVSVAHQFVVHQDCANSPTVIRISRHHHRISFTSSLPSGKWSCGVCRKAVDNNYGAYSCNKCDSYFVHTRCALRSDLWDGVELEEVPEEPEIVVEPFEVIAEGIILHFSHGHHLKLEVSRIYDNDKLCQACVLPIYEGNYYSCMDQCDFILHEVCANAPRMKHNPLHAHPLTLKVVTNQYNDNNGYFYCDACNRKSCGFIYKSDQRSEAFELDLRCASVSEPFDYQGHEDPLFLALTREEEKSSVCHICQERNDQIRKLNCLKCDYVICFECATLPYKARYKHDKHLLTFQKEKEASDESGWCELCEKVLVYSQDGGFYSCDDYCGTTLHVDCLLGRDMYMKPGQTIMNSKKEEIQILGNNSMSRPFCHEERYCREGRCPHRIVFKKENKTFCTHFCLYYYSSRRCQVSQLEAKITKPENKRPITSGFSGRTTKELTWKCIESCGACCKLAKDFAFATPDEIVEVCSVLRPPLVRRNYSVGFDFVRSMIGEDGWCINYDKDTCKCLVYFGIKLFCWFQASIHLIWRERNQRKHGENPMIPAQLVSILDTQVRNCLHTYRNEKASMERASEAWYKARVI